MSAEQSESHRLRELKLVRRVRDRIDRDHAQPLDVPTLAREVHLSPGHLSRAFKDAYGEPPYSYLMTRRIERAMTLLRSAELSVTDVCFQVGFSSLGTFSVRFSELVGISPSAYRAAAHDAITTLPPCVARWVSRPIRARFGQKSRSARS
ncbi:MAG: helix-turn-helix transcriptional regulator [Nocardioides sp.]